MNAHSPRLPAAAAAFEEAFETLLAVVHQRMEIEWHAHRRADLQRLEPDLWELLREFGALLRVVFRHRLYDALHEEAGWYAATLAARGPGRDAFGLLLDSWIVAIQGVIKPPESDELAAPLQKLRQQMSAIFENLEARRRVAVPEDIRAFVSALLAGERAEAMANLRARLAAGLAPGAAITHLILPALVEIGSRWERNEVAIYQEHLATETALQLLAGLAACAPAATALQRKALVSCAPNDHMQIVALALSVYLELRGWTACSLGQGLPAEQIVAAAAALRPDAVFLSLAMLARLTDALEVVERLGQPPARPPIFIGGRGAELGRTLLENAGARVLQDFDAAHRAALAAGGARHA